MLTIDIPNLPAAITANEEDLLHLRQEDIDKKLSVGDFRTVIAPPATETVSGVVTKATPSQTTAGTNNDTYITPQRLQQKIDELVAQNNLVPSRAIIMWPDGVDTIPAGFVLCDGTNGTPDLRDKFVVGAGSTYSAGDTGGNLSVNTSSSGQHIHTTQESGQHTHTSSNAGQHSHTTENAGQHNHSGSTGDSGQHNHSGSTVSGGAHNHGSSTGSAGSHTHSARTGNAGSHNHGGTGSAGAHTHAITVAGHALTIAQMPSHSHNVSFLTVHAGSGVEPWRVASSRHTQGPLTATSTSVGGGQAHSHGASASSAGNHAHTISNDGVHFHSISADGVHNHTIPTEGNHAHAITNDGNHNHTISGDGNHNHTVTQAGNHNHTISAVGGHVHAVDSSGAHTHNVETVPPYYAICYIMKT